MGEKIAQVADGEAVQWTADELTAFEEHDRWLAGDEVDGNFGIEEELRTQLDEGLPLELPDTTSLVKPRADRRRRSTRARVNRTKSKLERALAAMSLISQFERKLSAEAQTDLPRYREILQKATRSALHGEDRRIASTVADWAIATAEWLHSQHVVPNGRKKDDAPNGYHPSVAMCILRDEEVIDDGDDAEATEVSGAAEPAKVEAETAEAEVVQPEAVPV